ncbi:MAG: hypothetical protein V4711_03550, partial [Pseudomonadota bacterium]
MPEKSRNFSSRRLHRVLIGAKLTAQSQAWQKKAPSVVAQNVHPSKPKVFLTTIQQQEILMAKTVADVMKMVKENEV